MGFSLLCCCLAEESIISKFVKEDAGKRVVNHTILADYYLNTVWELNNFNCATRQTAQVHYDLNVKCHVEMIRLKKNKNNK